jgi:hypothetical protein
MSSLSDQLQTRFRMLECTRNKIESLYQANAIVARDLQSLYAGLFISVVTEFESFLEAQFVQYLTGRSRAAKPRVVMSRKSVAYDILRGERSYVDWLPFRYSIKRADRFFKDGHAFSFLDKSDVKILEDICLIRNALAHNSRYSKQKFEKDILGGMCLRPKERNPVGYLRYSFKRNTVYFQHYSQQLLIFSKKISR